MTTYVLIHGAAGSAWEWHLVSGELGGRGHDVVAMDLPCDDDSAGLAEYTDAVIDAIGERTGLVLVAQSFGGFTAPLVCDRVPVDLLVMLTAMIPSPGEPPGDWWDNTGYTQAKREQAERDGSAGEDEDVVATFLHDVPPGPGGRGHRARAAAIQHPDGEAVAARGVARCTDEVPALSR